MQGDMESLADQEKQLKDQNMEGIEDDSKTSRRDFLANTTLTAAALGLGVTRATVSAAEPAKRAPAGAKIASLAIFPAIGICRVGNSKKYFYAPEVPGVTPNPEGGFKDGVNKVKKQVQRFRIYGFDVEGRVVREINTGEGDSINWTVHVANTKGAWYQFNSPMDMGAETPGLTGEMRNQFFSGRERESLLIDPGPASIDTASKPKKPVEMVGYFWKRPNRQRVKLGELRIDEKGRLVVHPGNAVGASATPGNGITSFSDNDGWYDDWCDGPVQASVKLKDGRKMDPEPAWVTCCGPNWAPHIHAFTTMYDVVRDVMVHGKPLIGQPALEPKLPDKISFLEEIYPIFHRLGMMEWLSEGAQLREGWINVGDFLDEKYIKRLADPSKANLKFRESVFRHFRHQNDPKPRQYKLPDMLGSGANYDPSPAHWLIMPKLQHEILKKWRDGKFVDDLDRPEANIRSIEEVALEHRPASLTRAALEPCSGGAFHPGVEMTWPLRQAALYDEKWPYRIKLGNRPSLLQNDVVGRQMNPLSCFNLKTIPPATPHNKSGEAYTFKPGPNAPIGPQMPGDLTRWMGLPWFGDAFSCGLAVEYANDFPNAIWWPALTPIDVLPELYYNQIAAEGVSDEVKLSFYEKRVAWVRGVRGIGLHVEASYMDGLSRAVDLWNRLGFVVKKKRPANLSPTLKKIIPETLYVEVDRGSMDLMTDQPPNPGRNAGSGG